MKIISENFRWLREPWVHDRDRSLDPQANSRCYTMYTYTYYGYETASRSQQHCMPALLTFNRFVTLCIDVQHFSNKYEYIPSSSFNTCAAI